MVVDRDNLTFAVRNVARWGDTDVLPYPLENHWFHDAEEQVSDLLQSLDRNFQDWLSSYEVFSERALSGVGYLGFRSATQIDPIWNAYLLGLTLQVAPEIEQARLDPRSKVVFSYRLDKNLEDLTLFDRSIGWSNFQQHALQMADRFKFVLSTDISDFYSRIYHHRVENDLHAVTENKEAVNRISLLLRRLSGGVSYGLPIGGNAARILAELVLNRTDHLLNTRGVPFCRFVDDYFLFAPSEQEARSHLLYLAETLQVHEGLSLHRVKTRLMSAEQFARTSPMAPPTAPESAFESEAQEFLKLRLMYDPYSPTADEDYDQLVAELRKFDVVGMLARELRKSRVDEALVRQLVKSVRYLAESSRDAAVQSLVQNLEVLYPLFPTVSIVFRKLMEDLSEKVREDIFSCFRQKLFDRSYIFAVPANLCFALRILAQDRSAETTRLLDHVYRDPASLEMVRRDVILAMSKRGANHWVADALRRSIAPPWRRRALVVASYLLGDEGSHWRGRIKREVHEVDRAFMAWVGAKNDGRLWEIPL